LSPTIVVPLAQAGVQLEKLVTIRLRLLDREINVLFRFQVSREAFGTHSEIRKGKALADVITISSQSPFPRKLYFSWGGNRRKG
jgi:hypothetical protein